MCENITTCCCHQSYKTPTIKQKRAQSFLEQLLCITYQTVGQQTIPPQANDIVFSVPREEWHFPTLHPAKVVAAVKAVHCTEESAAELLIDLLSNLRHRVRRLGCFLSVNRMPLSHNRD